MNRTLILLSLLSLLFASCRQAPKPFKVDNNVYTFDIDGGVYSISAITDDIIKVSYQDSITYGDRVYAPILSEAMPMAVQTIENEVNLSTSEIRVSVTISPFSIQFYDLESGLKLGTEGGLIRNQDTTSLKFQLLQEESIYGTGARAIPLNRRGYAFQSYNQPNYGYEMGAAFLNYSIPHIYSSNEYMLLIDNPAKAFWDIGKTEEDIMSFSSLGGNIAFYFINGDSFGELIGEYIELTGSQPLPPIWAFGHLQSRFGYRTRAQADSILNLALEAGYPVDAIILDIFWFGEEIEDGKMGQLSWDLDNWPRPEEMMQNWANKGVKTITVSEPFFTRKSKNFNYLAENNLLATDKDKNTLTISDFYFGDAGLLDIFKPEAKDWLWEQYHTQKQKGVDGWWVDLGEPEKHPDTMYHVIGKATAIHGLYSHEWTKTLYNKYVEFYPEERLFKLGRAGYAGSQRYGLIPWTGDVSRSWSGLRAQLPALLGTSLSGLAYMHSDAGGFAGPDQIPELYVRWMQFAVFTPVFRPHSNPDVPAEPVLWSKEVQNVLRPYIEWRYRLLPYNYTLAFENMRTGMPMMRPLFIEFDVPDTIMNEYLWGDALLIAPVLDPGVSARSIYLPEGKWFDFWTGKAYRGGQWTEIPVTIENIPVLAREGHMVTLAPVFSNTEAYATDSLELRYYVGENDFESSIYMDDGKTKGAYEKGQYQLLTTSVNVENGTYQINFALTGDGFTGAPGERTADIVIYGLAQRPESVDDGENVNFRWDEERKILRFELMVEDGRMITIKM